VPAISRENIHERREQCPHLDRKAPTDALVVFTVLPQILKTASSPEETDKTVVD
jgi:hypothetical protein